MAWLNDEMLKVIHEERDAMLLYIKNISYIFFSVCFFTVKVQVIVCILWIRATVLDANHSP